MDNDDKEPAEVDFTDSTHQTTNPLIQAAQNSGLEAPNPSSSSSLSGAPKNEFTMRKTAAHAMMDAALFMANISQLRILLANDSATARFFVPLLCLILFSILCQILFAVIILIIWARQNHCHHSRQTTDTPEGDTKPSTTDYQQDHNSTSPRPQRSGASCSPCSHLWDRRMNKTYLFPRETRMAERSKQTVASSPTSSSLLQGRMTSVDMSGVTHTHEDDANVTFDVISWRLHVVTLLLVFLITIANMFITGLGFDSGHGVHVDGSQFGK